MLCVRKRSALFKRIKLLFQLQGVTIMDEIIPESANFLHPSLLLEHSINDNDFCMNNTVRSNYFSYLTNLLRTNATAHDIKYTQVQCYAQQIEIWALRKSLNSSVYREEMLKGIKILKNCHELNLPFTDISLDEYTGSITMNNRTLQYNNNSKSDSSSSNSSDITFDSTTESFTSTGGSSPCEMPSSTVKVEETPKATISPKNDLMVVGTSTPNNNDCQQNVTYDPIYQELEKMFNDDKDMCSSPCSTITADNNCLNNIHIWRCEYKIQKSSFLQQMYAIYVMNPEKYQRLEEQLKEIFGSSSNDDDVDDESSPKEVPIQELLKSLKLKVAHMVKQNLTPYYSMRRIKSSEVYKMVAKAITDRIVEFNPYMSYNNVKKAIRYCFTNKIKIIDAKNVKACIKIINWTIENRFKF